MRVAVCLSGQLRNWRLGWSNQKWFFGNQQGLNGSKFSVDYFAHTWNISQDRPKLSDPYSERKVDKEEFDEFVESFEISLMEVMLPAARFATRAIPPSGVIEIPEG